MSFRGRWLHPSDELPFADGGYRTILWNREAHCVRFNFQDTIPVLPRSTNILPEMRSPRSSWGVVASFCANSFQCTSVCILSLMVRINSSTVMVVQETISVFSSLLGNTARSNCNPPAGPDEAAPAVVAGAGASAAGSRITEARLADTHGGRQYSRGQCQGDVTRINNDVLGRELRK